MKSKTFLQYVLPIEIYLLPLSYMFNWNSLMMMFVRVSPNRLTNAEQNYRGSIVMEEQTGECGQEPRKESERYVVSEEPGEGIEHLS